ncbi:MAG: hypothetical protein J7L89_04960, partial [Bacteroidales bacterium]|nr:hypothetical protein [Bacteroidales bacterium]
ASRYINQVQTGDYLTASVLIRNNDPQNPARLILRSTNSDTDNIYFEDNHSLQDLGHGWQLLSLRGHISSVPATSQMECLVYYPGKKGIRVQSLSIKHFGERY